MSSDAAIILCGGKGTRFREISSEPKILTPFRGEKFIDYIIKYLRRQNIEKIILSLGHKSEEIIKYIQSKQYSNVEFIIETEKLDTGGAVLLVNSKLKSKNFKRFLILNGDTFWSENLPEKIINCSDQMVYLMAHLVKQNDRYGAINLKDGRLTFIRGNHQDCLVYSGIASIPSQFLENEVVKISLEDYLESLNGAANFSIFEFRHSVVDFGTVSGYNDFKRYN